MGGIEMWHPSSRYAHYQGDAAGSYTVEAGDTLHSIAQALWGDANLWYKIAEANGLTAESLLSPNQVLAIPAGVWRIHQTADTFRPYDAARFLGDTTPSPLYPTPKGSGDDCGGFGAILLIVVAVAVTAIVAPQLTGYAVGAALPGGGTAATATGLTAVFGGTSAAVGSAAAIGAGVVGGAVAGVAGSLASQAVGLATGIQDQFSWKQVALSGLAGGIGGGLGASGLFGEMAESGFAAGKIGIKSAVVDAGVRSVAGSIASQGIAIATGLQGKFDWAGVAAAGMTGGLAQGVTGLGGGLVLSNVAGGIAGTAGVSLVTGNSFGDTLIRSLPSIIGNTVGSLIASAVSGRESAGNPGSDEAQQAQVADTAAAREPAPGAGNGQVGYNIDVTSSLTGIDGLAGIDGSLRLSASFYLTLAGGDVQLARQLIKEDHQEVPQAASRSSPTSKVYHNLPTSGGDGSSIIPNATEGYALDRLSDRGNSIGHWQFADASRTTADWVVNPERTAAMYAELARFDLQMAGMLLSGPVIGGTGAAISIGAPVAYAAGQSAYTAGQSFVYANALRLGTASMVTADVVAGTQVGIYLPAAAGTGAAVFRAVDQIGAETEALATGKFVPNPNGKLGGPEHQALVGDITADINARGLIPRPEFRVPTPGGAKSARYVDVVAIDPATQLPVEYYQVGKQTLAGNPIAREAQAIRDIQKVTNKPITFKPYNK